MNRIGGIAGPGITVELDLGYRINPALSAGLYGSLATYALGDVMDRGSHVLGATAGIQAVWHVAPTRSIDPWLSVGTGWKTLLTSVSDGPDIVVMGFDIPRIQVGLDFRLSKDIAIAPRARRERRHLSPATTSTTGTRRSTLASSSSLDSWVFPAGLIWAARGLSSSQQAPAPVPACLAPLSVRSAVCAAPARREIGVSLHAVGNCHAELGQFAEALVWFERAVAAAEQGDVHARVDPDNLGVTAACAIVGFQPRPVGAALACVRRIAASSLRGRSRERSCHRPDPRTHPPTWARGSVVVRAPPAATLASTSIMEPRDRGPAPTWAPGSVVVSAPPAATPLSTRAYAPRGPADHRADAEGRLPMPTADGRLPNADDRCRWRTPLAACPAIIGFLERTWKRELDCRLIKEIWTYGSNRIPVRFSVGVR